MYNNILYAVYNYLLIEKDNANQIHVQKISHHINTVNCPLFVMS